jgi:hypothetical protein
MDDQAGEHCDADHDGGIDAELHNGGTGGVAGARLLVDRDAGARGLTIDRMRAGRSVPTANSPLPFAQYKHPSELESTVAAPPAGQSAAGRARLVPRAVQLTWIAPICRAAATSAAAARAWFQAVQSAR